MNLGLSGTFLYPAGKPPCAFTWVLGLGAKTRIFSQGALTNAGCPRNLLKIHPVSLLPYDTASFAPRIGISEESGGRGLQLLTWGPYEVQCGLNQVTTVWHAVPSDTPTACFLFGRTALT